MDAADGTKDRGEVLDDRYRLGEVLGAGGMAQVRRARDVVLDRDVAVKVLHDSVDDGERRRFVGEARTLAGLSHENLVTVLDAGITSERPYLVMELVEGRTLADAVRDGRLAPPVVASVGEQLARALAYAHERGIVHRDVKPANVLLDQQGRVKLADFGIAKLLGETVSHTRTGTTIGTAAYLSPEQVQGQAVGEPSDVYSLALVLLEALTGARAYPGSPTEAALARLHRPPDVPPSLPAPWPTLLTEMADLDPGRRPAAAQVAATLAGPSSATGGTTTRVLPTEEEATSTRVLPSPPTPTPEPARAGSEPGPSGRTRALPRWWPVAAAVLLLLVVVVVAALAARSGNDPSDDIPPETPRELREPLRDLHDAVNGG